MDKNKVPQINYHDPFSGDFDIPVSEKKEVVEQVKETKKPKREAPKEIPLLRPLKRVNTEMFEELDKAIELLAVEEGIKKRDLINELLEIGLKNRKK